MRPLWPPRDLSPQMLGTLYMQSKGHSKRPQPKHLVVPWGKEACVMEVLYEVMFWRDDTAGSWTYMFAYMHMCLCKCEYTEWIQAAVSSWLAAFPRPHLVSAINAPVWLRPRLTIYCWSLLTADEIILVMVVCLWMDRQYTTWYTDFITSDNSYQFEAVMLVFSELILVALTTAFSCLIYLSTKKWKIIDFSKEKKKHFSIITIIQFYFTENKKYVLPLQLWWFIGSS